jgi:ANTAR domain-containing protein
VPDDRLTILLGLISEPAQGSASLPQRVCRTSLHVTSMSGAVLALISHSGHDGTIAATDRRSRSVHERQFTFGEGPGVEAFSTGEIAGEPDLGAEAAAQRWPVFASTAHHAGVAAAFAFPLSLGTARVGALCWYRDTAGPLTDHELRDGSLLATIATVVLIALQAGSPEPESNLHPQLANSAGPAVVHQATGMAMVQLDVPIAQAFVVLRAYAFAHDRALADVAADIVARRIVLE